MRKPIYHSELVLILEGILSGDLTITPIDDPKENPTGDIRYQVSNGWKFTVFNDGDEFDYFDSFEAPDGRKIGENYNEIYPTVEDIESFQSAERRLRKVSAEILGIGKDHE